MFLVLLDLAREPSCNRPDAACIQGFQQHGMRHQPSHAAVPVQKWVNPEEPVMRCSCAENCVSLVQATVNLLEAAKETRDCPWTHGDVRPHLDIPVPQFAREDPDLVLCLPVFHPQKVIRQAFAEPTVYFADAVNRGRATSETASVNPLLNGNMGFGLQLEVALPGIVAIVVFQCTLNIHRVRVVPFDKVAVVAVHRAYKI